MFRSLLALIALSACGTVVPQTADQLSRMSPLTADPADIAVALDIPAAYDITEATLVLDASRSDTGETQSGTFRLARTDAADGRIFYAIAGPDLDRIRALQQTIAVWETETPEASSGSLSVFAQPCRRDPGSDAGGGISVFIRLDSDGTFQPLVRKAPVTAILGRDGAAELPLCA